MRLDTGGLLDAVRAAAATSPLCALGGCACLLVELDPRALVPDRQQAQALEQWLQRQACPVIGIARTRWNHPLAIACDTVVESEADAASLTQLICAAPLAALVLVQVLRVTERLEIGPALQMESLAYATLQGGAEFRAWLRGAVRPAPGPPAANAPAVLVERSGERLQLRLNRPQRRNALSVEMRDALIESLELAAADATINEIVLSGEGTCFSSGGDLGEFGTAADPAAAHTVRSARPLMRLLAECAPRLRCHVQGAAVGAGAEMAAFAGVVSASSDAFFQLPELRYGLIPGCGGCVSIPRRIGRQRAAYLALSARRIAAPEALELGLVDRLDANERAAPPRVTGAREARGERA